jgi:hypothetical protein
MSSIASRLKIYEVTDSKWPDKIYYVEALTPAQAWYWVWKNRHSVGITEVDTSVRSKKRRSGFKKVVRSGERPRTGLEKLNTVYRRLESDKKSLEKYETVMNREVLGLGSEDEMKETLELWLRSSVPGETLTLEEDE